MPLDIKGLSYFLLMFLFALTWKRSKTLFRPSFEEASKGTLEISFQVFMDYVLTEKDKMYMNWGQI